MNNLENLQNKVHVVGLVLVAATLPLPSYPLNNFCIILLAVNWLTKIIKEQKITIGRQDLLITILSLLLFLTYLIGVFYSSNQQAAWSSIERKLPLLAFALVVTTSPVLTNNQLRLVLICFLISCLVVSVACVTYTFYINKQDGIEFVFYNNWYFAEENLIRKFGFHHVYFSMYMCFCLVILLYFFISSNNGRVRLGLMILAVYIVLFMMALSSRMGIVVLGVLLVLTIFLLIKGTFLVKTALLAGLLTVIGLVGYQFPFIKGKFTGLLSIDVDIYTAQYRASTRMITIESTWSIFKDNWMFGVGTGDLNDLLIKEYENKHFEEGLAERYNPHEQYLDTGASVGILGLIALLGMILFPLYLSIKSRDFFALTFIVIVFFFFLTESMLARQKGVVFFSFFLLLLSVRRRSKGEVLFKF